MADSQTTSPHNPASDCSKALATEFLNALRRDSIERATKQCRSDQEALALAKKLESGTQLPTDKAAYAIALAYCLGTHFSSVLEISTTNAFAVIRCRTGDDTELVSEVLTKVLPYKAEQIAHNPQYGLDVDEIFVVIGDVGVRHKGRTLSFIAEAAERCIPVFCTLSADAPIPSSLVGAELLLDLPPMTTEMLTLLFEVAHGGVPQDISSFKSSNKLTTPDLVAHIRRARPVDDCLAGLRQSACPQILKPNYSAIRLQDVVGYGDAKTWALELVHDMDSWRGGKLDWEDVDHRAVVLSGPPGTGKTSFAGILAGSLNVPLIASNVAEWHSHKHLSGTLNRMKEVFAEAISSAPCVLLIDEVDGISNRTQIGGDYVEYWTQIVNLMLVLVTEALGTHGVIIVGAANHLERIDPALLRAGRLGRQIRIELPDADAIAGILTSYIGARVQREKLSLLAQGLVGQTGADIEDLVRAAKATARRAGRTFSISDIEENIQGPQKNLSPIERRRIAIYRNAQRIVADVLGLTEMAPRDGEVVRHLSSYLAQGRFPTEQTCNDVLAVIMAGRAGEEIVFGDVSTLGSGHLSSDLAVATAIAKDLEFKTGFGECGVIYFDNLSHLTVSAVASVRRRIEAALARASRVLLDNAVELERVDGRGRAPTPIPNIRVVH